MEFASSGAVLALQDGAARVTIAALAIFAVYGMGYSTTAVAVIGACLSVQAMIIAAGSLALYYSSVAIISSLSTSALTTLAMGLAGLAAGYFALEYHNIVTIKLHCMTPEKYRKHLEQVEREKRQYPNRSCLEQPLTLEYSVVGKLGIVEYTLLGDLRGFTRFGKAAATVRSYMQ